jgi:hypothetical protein
MARLRRHSLEANPDATLETGTLRAWGFRDSTWRLCRDSLGAQLRRYATVTTTQAYI